MALPGPSCFCAYCTISRAMAIALVDKMDREIMEDALAHGLVHEAHASAKLEEWWMETSELDFHGYDTKAREYGSVDLEIIGEAMKKLNVRSGEIDPQELGIAFYLQGKVARLFGAYAEGREPSDDTLHDIVVYAMMMRLQRHRAKEELRSIILPPGEAP